MTGTTKEIASDSVLRAGHFGLRAHFEATGARNAVAYRSRMPDLLIRVTELIENRLTTEPPGEM